MSKAIILKENGQIFVSEFQGNMQEEIERYFGSTDLVSIDDELYTDVCLIYARGNSNPNPFSEMLELELFGDVFLAHEENGEYEGLNDGEIFIYRNLDAYMLDNDVESSLYLISDKGIFYHTSLEEAIEDFQKSGFYKDKYKALGIEYSDRNQETQIQDVVKQYKDQDDPEYASYYIGNIALDGLSSFIKDQMEFDQSKTESQWRYEVRTEKSKDIELYSLQSISPAGIIKEMIRSNSSAILELISSSLIDAEEQFEKANSMLGGLGDVQRIDCLSDTVAEVEENLKGYSKIALYYVNAISFEHNDLDEQKGIFVESIMRQKIESSEFENFVYSKLELAMKRGRKYIKNKLLKTPEFVSAIAELNSDDKEENRRKVCKIVYDTMKDEFV